MTQAIYHITLTINELLILDTAEGCAGEEVSVGNGYLFI